MSRSFSPCSTLGGSRSTCRPSPRRAADRPRQPVPGRRRRPERKRWAPRLRPRSWVRAAALLSPESRPAWGLTDRSHRRRPARGGAPGSRQVVLRPCTCAHRTPRRSRNAPSGGGLIRTDGSRRAPDHARRAGGLRGARRTPRRSLRHRPGAPRTSPTPRLALRLRPAGGLAAVGPHPRPRRGRRGEILTLAVHPAARRQGTWASPWYRPRPRSLRRWAPRASGWRWRRTTWRRSALYTAAGFEPVGRRRGYYPRPEGAVDALSLRCRLNSAPA